MNYLMIQMRKLIDNILVNRMISSKGFRIIENNNECGHQYPIVHRLYDKKENGKVYRYTRCLKCKTINKYECEAFSPIPSAITVKTLKKEFKKVSKSLERFLFIDWYSKFETQEDTSGFIYDAYFSKSGWQDCPIKSGHVLVLTNKGVVEAQEASSNNYYVDLKGKKIYDKSVKIYFDIQKHNEVFEDSNKEHIVQA
jgi:hypothetical protein